MTIAVIGNGNIGATLGQRWAEHGLEVIYGSRSVHYARAFNTLGWENFATPPDDADLCYAADEQARQRTEQLITAVGLRPAYVGNGDAAPTVDALLPLWFALVNQRGTRLLALRIVDRQPAN